jgi:hypothetical protein
VSFHDDGQAALDWVQGYLEGVRTRPVLARVAPGEIRARLPDAPPDDAEPFADVLRDLDELLLPGITHWNHPRCPASRTGTTRASSPTSRSRRRRRGSSPSCSRPP